MTIVLLAVKKHILEFNIRQKNRYLHSKEHVLADDLSKAMLEPKKFAAYLGIARLYYESDLRSLARRVSEKNDLEPKNRGRYFFGALRRLEKKQTVISGNKKETKRKKAGRTRLIVKK